MRAHCTRCDLTVDVDAEDARCPKCLRRSTLKRGDRQPASTFEPRSSEPVRRSTPEAARGAPGAALVGGSVATLALLVCATSRSDLTPWMTVTDACLILGLIIALLWAWRRRFFDLHGQGVTARRGAQIVGGSAFALVTAALLFGAFMMLRDPWALEPGRRLGPTHGWAMGLVLIGMAVFTGQIARLLLARLFARTPELRSAGALVPLRGVAPPLTEPRAYREPALPKVVSLDDLARALASVPSTRIDVDGPRLLVRRAPNRSPLVLTVESRGDVRLGAATLETPDEHLAIAVCFAFVPLLGPHCLTLEGDDIVIDGSRSLEDLDVDHLHRMGQRLARGQVELEKLFDRLRERDGL
jgi:protein-S-isoprenylcysteine O-methyltransferase Ste14